MTRALEHPELDLPGLFRLRHTTFYMREGWGTRMGLRDTSYAEHAS